MPIAKHLLYFLITRCHFYNQDIDAFLVLTRKYKPEVEKILEVRGQCRPRRDILCYRVNRIHFERSCFFLIPLTELFKTWQGTAGSVRVFSEHTQLISVPVRGMIIHHFPVYCLTNSKVRAKKYNSF